MVEGKGFIASPSRLSAYFAEHSRRQTALEGPLEPFRVPIRPRFLGSRRRQNRAGWRQMPWTTHGEHEESAISPSTDPRLVSRSSAPPPSPSCPDYHSRAEFLYISMPSTVVVRTGPQSHRRSNAG